MTDDQYRELVEFLGGKFEGIDRRFDSVDRKFDSVDRRFAEVDRRFDEVDRRFDDMDRRFDSVEERLGGLEQRTSALEVGLESLRSEVQVVAEGVTANTARLDRVETTMNRRFDHMEELWLDHEGRIRALES